MNSDTSFTDLIEVLKRGGVAVVRTDTLYGLIALARSEVAVERVYEIKNRSTDKPCITLIANADAVPLYAKRIAEHSSSETPTSVIVPVTNEGSWITRGGVSVAYRVVRDDFLKRVVEAVGPVIAPSANPEGMPPAHTIEEARAYFGDTVDMYIDGGTVPAQTQASRIIRVNENGSIDEVRTSAQQ